MKVSDSGHNLSLLDSLDLFRGLAIDRVESYLNRCERADVRAGQVLLSPEQDNDNVYVILSGTLRIHLDSLDNPPLTELNTGACVGEMSVIEGKKPSAYVVAAEDTHLMVISHDVLWELVETSHTFAKNLLAVLSRRVRSDNEMIADSVGILRQFERNAITDALTDLHNRHWMKDMFRRKMSRSRKDGEPLCLVMVDIDHFKRYNDRYGHLAGDNALCHVAQVLRNQFRPSDLVARFGGDEFAALLPNTSLSECTAIANRVREAVAEPIEVDLEEIIPGPITISAGVAEMAAQDTLETLLHNADAAMYRAKLKGRDCVSD